MALSFIKMFGGLHRICAQLNRSVITIMIQIMSTLRLQGKQEDIKTWWKTGRHGH